MNRTGICHLLELNRIQYATGRLTMTVIDGDQRSDDDRVADHDRIERQRLRIVVEGQRTTDREEPRSQEAIDSEDEDRGQEEQDETGCRGQDHRSRAPVDRRAGTRDRLPARLLDARHERDRSASRLQGGPAVDHLRVGHVLDPIPAAGCRTARRSRTATRGRRSTDTSPRSRRPEAATESATTVPPIR